MTAWVCAAFVSVLDGATVTAGADSPGVAGVARAGDGIAGAAAPGWFR